jgi:signal transduction histidine kinase
VSISERETGVREAQRLTSYSVDGRPGARQERILAVGRAFLTITALVAIYLDPTEPARLAAVTYGVLFTYALYSLALLALVHSAPRLAPAHGYVIHGLDVLWTSGLTLVSEGPVSPFFLFFLFVVLASAYRWGFRETIITAATTVGIFLVETAVVATGPWNQTGFASISFELNRTILRSTYLLITGFLLGYLGEQQKQARAESAAIAEAARQPRIDLGLGGSVSAVAGDLMETFGAASVAIVLQEYETSQTVLWRVERAADGAGAIQRQELSPEQRGSWLFEDAGPVWQASAWSLRDEAVVRATVPGEWPLRRTRSAVPVKQFVSESISTVTGANMGMSGQWRGRVYLFDIGRGGSLERRLHFLDALVEHIAHGLTNVFLLSRLHSKAGATERARVARELHDGTIQALCGIEMKVEALRRKAAVTATDVRLELEDVQELLRQEILGLRELMQALRPIELDAQEQLPDVLASVVERFRRDTGVSARFVSQGGAFVLEPNVALEVVRIVQEALVNVRKHSRARNVAVRLSRDNGRCRLVVEDDGRGFEFEGHLSAEELDRQRVGPAIIKERARIIGAALSLHSAPDVGARIELTFEDDVNA